MANLISVLEKPPPHITIKKYARRIKKMPVKPGINIDHIVTEDDTPVDNIPSEKNQRLLTGALYSSWDGAKPGEPFLVAANVGVFYDIEKPPIVPDVFLSLEVKPKKDMWEKKNRTYFVQEFGKIPEVVIEIVSNKKGYEDSTKMKRYAEFGPWYYVIFDPKNYLKAGILRVYKFDRYSRSYELMHDAWLSKIGLGVTVWQGDVGEGYAKWLRWCDKHGNILPTGDERAELERQQAELERQRAERERRQAERERRQAERERQRAELAESRVSRLLAQMAAAGIEPHE